MGLFKKNQEPEMVEREDGLIDYDVYVMSKEEKMFNIAIAAVVIFGIGYMCYRSIILSALLAIVAVKWPKMRVKQIIKKRHSELVRNNGRTEGSRGHCSHIVAEDRADCGRRTDAAGCADRALYSRGWPVMRTYPHLGLYGGRGRSNA